MLLDPTCRARLKEIRFSWDEAWGWETIQKADDVFAVISRGHWAMPKRPRITLAGFLVKFTDEKVPRSVTVRAGNIAEYTRDDDSDVVEEWLVKRAFITTEGQE